EADAHFVGGGGMLLEGILGLTSVVAVGALTSTKGGALSLYVSGGAKYLSNLLIPSAASTAIMALMVLILGLTLTQLALRFARLYCLCHARHCYDDEHTIEDLRKRGCGGNRCHTGNSRHCIVIRWIPRLSAD